MESKKRRQRKKEREGEGRGRGRSGGENMYWQEQRGRRERKCSRGQRKVGSEKKGCGGRETLEEELRGEGRNEMQLIASRF